MTDSDVKAGLLRHAKGKRPQYFEDPATDKLMAMVLALAEELSVTRERLDALERVLQASGDLPANAVDDWVPDEAAAQEREARRQAFVARLFRVVEAELDALQGERGPVDEARVRDALD